MTSNDIGEIKRHVTQKRTNITKIYGCYVNGIKQIISTFSVSTGVMTETECGMYLNLLKKVLSGSTEKNLVEIDLTHSEDSRDALLALKNSELGDSEREEFFQKVIDAVDMEGENYLILAACDTYDVPYRDESGQLDYDQSEEIFSFVLCGICPVKDTKPELCYESSEREFHTGNVAQVAGAPIVGFMYPAFTDRYTDLDHVLYYVKKPDEPHDEFVEAIFESSHPVTVVDKRDAFSDALREAVDGPCLFETYQAIHRQVYEASERQKGAEDPEEYSFATEEMEAMLSKSGLEKTQVNDFSEKFLESFGADEMFAPAEIMDASKFEVKTPQAKITISPAASSLVTVREVDGRKYILIPADEGIEINGFTVK